MAQHLSSFMLPVFRTLNTLPKSQFFRFASTTGPIDPLVQSLFDGIYRRDRVSLARSITLVESLHPKKRQQGRQLVEAILSKQRDQSEIPSFRIGLSGPPGTGKSTFIEVFGKMLTDSGRRVAVLTVDPSSAITGGSLLGDKTRMTLLARDMNAFIRPSPTGGTLGGVTRSTNEAILLCEAAGFDIVIVETVGVGQSETAVADMVDLFLLLIPPAGGDELQGMKRGIVELADIIAVTKADGDLEDAAKRIQSEYMSAVRITRRKSVSWKPRVMRMSSRTKAGIDDLWKKIEEFRKVTQESGDLLRKRTEQRRVWMWKYIENDLMSLFYNDERVKKQIHRFEEQVQRGELSPGTAADMILAIFLNTAHADENC